MHHGVRAGALHMKTDWHQIVTAGDELAVDAPLTDKSSIICRTGMLMLASGTGAWRVRDTMNRVAAVLGVTIHVDLSLLRLSAPASKMATALTRSSAYPQRGSILIAFG